MSLAQQDPVRHGPTKILATLGPSSADMATIRLLVENGADAFRINFSHGSHEGHRTVVERIRSVEAELSRPICILADLQGPKVRIGECPPEGIALSRGQILHFALDQATGVSGAIPLPHKEVFEAIQTGDSLLIDDGRIVVTVREWGPNLIKTVVETGGVLKSRKGLNLPARRLPVSALTPKDLADLEAALEWGVDWVALSFVQSAADLLALREIVGSRAALMAKIEKPLALDDIDAISGVADGLMVARGDLGVEISPEFVPGAQRRIIAAARKAGIPVVVATQMLESMIENPTPTRAEVSDVATAILDGADAIMLSAETASGRHPVEAVSMMQRITHTVSQDADYYGRVQALAPDLTNSTPDAISESASHMADTVEAGAIVCFTTSGSTARRIARMRPCRPLIVLTPSTNCARQLALAWGTRAFVTPQPASFEAVVSRAIHQFNELQMPGDANRIVITAGVPFGRVGSTNVVHVAELEADPQAFS